MSHVPDERLPVADWLRTQTRFKHLFRPEADGVLDRIQEQVDADWASLLERCTVPA
jgi:pyruvate ferredoxin oxidoreductase beta subunit